MLLAIDVGNTNTVLGCFWDKDLKKTWRVSTHPIGTADEFRAKMHGLFKLDGIEMGAFRDVVVSSVVPTYTAMLRTVFANTNLYVVDHQTPFSFRIKADPASQVGADRLVNAEAVVREHGAPAIIVDSGTATTICAVARGVEGPEYRGGAIMPGIELSIEALAKRAAKLFMVEMIPPTKAIGSNTSEAMRSGVLLGYASMIDGMVRRFKEELGDPTTKVVATGGVSQLLKGLTTELTHFDADLTLKGIAYLYESVRAR